MAISTEDGPIAYLLSCLHIQRANVVNATELYCMKCHARRQSVQVVDDRWRVICAHCTLNRFVHDRLAALELSRKHLTRKGDHELSIYDGTGTKLHTMRHETPPLFVDEATGAPF